MKADGSCLFNSISLVCYGTQQFAYELRLRCCRPMYERPYLFDAQHLSTIYGRDLSTEEHTAIIQTSAEVRRDQSMTGVLLEGAKSMVNSSKYASVLEVVACATILDINIDLVYPCTTSYFTKRELFSGLLKCSPMSRQVHISWTHTGDTATGSGKWCPNNFVPCFKGEVIILIVYKAMLKINFFLARY